MHPNVYTLCLHQLQFYLSIGTESFSLVLINRARAPDSARFPLRCPPLVTSA